MKENRVIPARITRPRPRNVCERERLFLKLDNARQSGRGWVSAPAGAGKTTLISSYIENRRLPYLWYHVDETDGDMAGFFYYLKLATEQINQRCDLPLLTMEYLQNLGIFTKRFFEKMFEALPAGCIIVFENFHDAPEESPIKDLLYSAIALIPEGFSIIITSRHTPPAEFHRYIGSGELLLLQWEDLRFTFDESKELVAPAGLPAAAVDWLYRRTDGWAAGLVLLLVDGNLSVIVEEQRPELNQRAVFDYFLGEIMKKLDEATLDFLFIMSVLPRFNTQIAAALTGNDSVGLMIDRLHRHNFFLYGYRLQASEPYVGEAYQFHPLFRDFLQTRAVSIFAPHRIEEIRNQAAQLLVAANQHDEAVELFLLAENWEQAVNVLLSQAPFLVAQGRATTLDGWLRRLPEKKRKTSPALLYWSGICLLAFDPLRSRRIFEQAFALYRERDDREGMMLCWVAIVDTYIYVWDDFAPLREWITFMENLLSTGRGSGTTALRAGAGLLIAMTYCHPDHPDIARQAETVFAGILEEREPSLRLSIGNHLILYYLWIGDFSRLSVVIDALQPAGDVQSLDPLTRQNWYMLKAMYSWLTADWPSCRQAIEAGLKNADDSGIHLIDHYLLGDGIWGGLSLGDPATAEDCFQKLATLRESPLKSLQTIYHYQAASMHWFRGDFRRSIEHSRIALRLSKQVHFPMGVVMALIELSITLIDDGQHDEAERCLTEALHVGQGMIGLRFHAHLLKAGLSFSRGDDEAGVASLETAMSAGARYGFVNLPRWKNERFAPILAKAMQYGVETEYARKLIQKRQIQPPTQEQRHAVLSLVEWPYQWQLRTLGDFTVFRNGTAIQISTKVAKPLEMLKAIVAHGTQNVPASAIIDSLWPDTEGDTGRRSFDTTLHRLRKWLGDDRSVFLENGRLTLSAHLWGIDVRHFRGLLSLVEHSLTEKRSRSRDFSYPVDLDLLRKKTLQLYRGPFLPGVEASWIIPERERLSMIFVRLIILLGSEYEKLRQWDGARAVYEGGIVIEITAEELYQRLISVFLKMGQKAEAVKTYHRCRTILQDVHGTTPSATMERIYAQAAGDHRSDS